MIRYIKSAQMACLEKTNGGVLYLMPDIFIKICTLIPLIYMWKAVMSSGADVGMTMDQMLTYTYAGALLSDMMVVRTQATVSAVGDACLHTGPPAHHPAGRAHGMVPCIMPAGKAAFEPH
ncbi:MAG TPA: hypothetical protein PK767_11225 [Clostridiales bacterium]|nr:hypothetical protein [Clostridiales bacterium]